MLVTTVLVVPFALITLVTSFCFTDVTVAKFVIVLSAVTVWATVPLTVLVLSMVLVTGGVVGH